MNNQLLKSMKKDYLLSKDNTSHNFKSIHWNVFEENYEENFNFSKLWDTFLRNSLSLGLNDSLSHISNERFKGNSDLWKTLKNCKKNLISKKIVDENEIKQIRTLLFYLLKKKGLNFVEKNLMSKVGDPQTVDFDVKDKNKTLKINKHDIMEIFYKSYLDDFCTNLRKRCNPLIIEIGGGFGNMASKIKKTIPNCKYVILDLPEVNSLQKYYLSKEFKGKKILGITDVKNESSFNNLDFDFLILPGWMINKFSKNSIDGFINVRSMMEMNYNTIDFYFQEIQKLIKKNGLFACFNRFHKKIGIEIISFEKYPFDNLWKIVLSEKSLIQPDVNMLIVKRL